MKENKSIAPPSYTDKAIKNSLKGYIHQTDLEMIKKINNGCLYPSETRSVSIEGIGKVKINPFCFEAQISSYFMDKYGDKFGLKIFTALLGRNKKETLKCWELIDRLYEE